MKCRECTALLFGIAMFLGCGPAVTDNTIVKDRVNAALPNGVSQGTGMADPALIQKAVSPALARFPPAAARE